MSKFNPVLEMIQAYGKEKAGKTSGEASGYGDIVNKFFDVQYSKDGNPLMVRLKPAQFGPRETAAMASAVGLPVGDIFGQPHIDDYHRSRLYQHLNSLNSADETGTAIINDPAIQSLVLMRLKRLEEDRKRMDDVWFGRSGKK